MEPTLSEISDKLDALTGAVLRLEARSQGTPRTLYSRKEFAAIVGVSELSLLKPKYYRRFGGKKIGGRIMFSEAARLALARGERPT